MTTTKLKVLDLYSGIGGFSLGFHNAGGFETVGFCEVDKDCQKVLKKNFPNVGIHQDVKEFHGNLKIESFQDYTPFSGNVEVVCGGFPCQDVSVAGKKKGLIDEEGKRTRSGLWFEFKRIIKEIRPRWVIIENVRNLLNNGLATVLQDLHEIGYDAEWEVISARSVGAPHLRERIWIVAYPTNSKGKRVQGLRASGLQEPHSHDEEGLSLCSSEAEHPSATNSDDFRFWPSFTTEEEKQHWWAEATSGFRDRWEVEPTVCRVDDGLSKGLDKGRAQRVKQLGNSIVPQIAEIIGRRIMYHEGL
jgi:DNA (cytosine-5)-methyltransferase 1